MPNVFMGKAYCSWQLTVYAVAFTLILSSCSDDVEVDVKNAAELVTSKQLTLPIPVDQICSDLTVTTADGIELKGTRDCESSGQQCTKVGEINCVITDDSLYGIHDENLTPDNVRKGIKLGDKEGAAKSGYPLCANDGDIDCVVKDTMTVADVSAVAAKVPVGQTLAGQAGTYDPGYPSPSAVLSSETVGGQQGLLPTCQVAGESSCVTTATLRAVAKAELVATSIRKDVQIGGVTGTYEGAFAACAADGETDCILTGNLKAMKPSDLEAAKIRSSVRLAGVLGTLTPSPAQCDGSSKTGCVTNDDFPAADYGLVTAGNIKGGETIAHLTTTVTGAYPSAAEPFVDSSATKDLNDSNFNASMASADTFEYWDSKGVRHTNSGDVSLVAANLSRDATVFGVSGSLEPMPASCSDTLLENCVTSTNYVSYAKALLIPANLKNGTTITSGSAVNGLYPSADHLLPNASATADLKATSFNTQIADGGTSFEYWDSTGSRHSASGSATLIGTNLVTGTTVFGVAGAANIRPANCSDGNLLNCVTSLTHPSYSPALLPKESIKNGVSIGFVTGTYPSAANPIDGHNATIDDLSAATFNSQLTKAGNVGFEFWDNQGNRVHRTSNDHLSSIHLRTGKTVFGVSGDLPLRSNDCTAENQNDCVATAAFPSYLKSALTAAVLKKNTSILGVTGDYPSASHRLEGASAVADLGNQADLYGKLTSGSAFEYWDATGTRHESTGDTDLVATNIVDGVNAFGIAGAMTESPEDCTGEGQQNCVTTDRFKSYDSRSFTAGVLKKDQSLGGIVGDYPSATYPLESATATKDLRGSTHFDSDVSTADTVEFFGADGSRYAKAIPALVGSSIRQGVTLFGVAGAAAAAPALCSGTSVVSCLTSADFPAYQSGTINNLHLKSNVKIGRETGAYPSAASPMPGATGVPDLTASNFTSLIKNGSIFEYWNANGQRFTGTGSSHLSAKNILFGKSIFGVAGNLRNPTLPVAINKVRIGTTVNTSQGTRKVSCANTGPAGSSGKKNIDDHNNGERYLPSREPFGSHKSCRRNTFVDDRKNGVACTSSSRSCVFLDTISGLRWHSTKLAGPGVDQFYAAEVDFIDSASYCQSITGHGSGWRVPTHKELVAATVNGLRQTNLVGNVIFPYGSRTWTATKNSQNETMVKVVKPQRHLHKEHVRTDSGNYVRVLCVR